MSDMRTPLRQAVWDKTGGRCFYCGDQLLSDSARDPRLAVRQMEVDHRLSLRRGGTDELSNMVPACGGCNTRKGLKTVDEFRIWSMIVKGRAPSPFFGEAHRPDRDWLIVVSPRIPHSTPPTLHERMADFAGRSA